MTKYKAINQYHSQLGQELANRYGGANTYTQSQVLTAINDLGMNKDHIEYAYLLYCDKDYYEEHPIAQNEYDLLIKDIEKALDGGLWSKPVGLMAKVFGVGGSGGDVGGCGGGE